MPKHHSIRIRVYNTTHRHYYFKSKSCDAHPRVVRVVRHLTKKHKGKSYYSGRVNIPKILFRRNPWTAQYALIRLGRTHAIVSNEDLWGESFLLFVKSDIQSATATVTFDTRNDRCKKVRSKYSKFSKHRTTAKGKKYISPSIYVPTDIASQDIRILKLKGITKMVYPNKGLFVLKRLREDYGTGYILFYEKENVRLGEPINPEKNRPRSYLQTIIALRQGSSVRRTAKIRSIHPTTIWKHMTQAYENEMIDRTEFRNLIQKHCDEEVLRQLITIIDGIRTNDYEFEKQVRGDSIRVEKRGKISTSTRNVEEIYFKTHNIHLPINLVEAIIKFLEGQYEY